MGVLFFILINTPDAATASHKEDTMLTIQGTLDTCEVASTSNLSAVYANGVLGVGATLTSTVLVALVIDGIPLSVGDRVLVAGQTDAKQNGVYAVTDAGSVSVAWVLTRGTDFDNSANDPVKEGVFVFVQQGTLNANSSWIQTVVGTGLAGAIIIGTDNISFVEASSVLYSFMPGASVFVVKADTFGVGIAMVSSVSIGHTTPGGVAVTYTVTYANTARPAASVSSTLVFPTLAAALAYYATVVS
jgi:hypothetical protein